MSLNDYFAANGAVYLRPVGLPDCFPMPGLPHGCKPPSISMQHPCSAPQKPRTMAAVSPLHQVVPPQPTIGSYEGAFNASRTSSFAAALRKLAKQAVDPVSGEKDMTHLSPVSSPALNQGVLTPKRNAPNPPPPPVFLNNHQVSYASSSPPVVTIAPSRPVATHTSESRKVMDLSNVPPNSNSSSLSNGHIQESLGLKMESNKSAPRPAHSDKWEEHSMSNKSLSASSSSSQVRPHATIAPLPRPDDSLTSSRGFQPYRGTEDARNTLPHHLSLFDHHHSASYPYSPAFLPPHHLSHPAYRFDDPLYLERYSLLRPPVMPYPPQAGMMAPPAAFYPNSRYAADLIAQSLSLSSANNSILNHERLKQEEERRLREKEMELDQSRSKEHERQREKEQKEKDHREREHKEREQRERDKREREKAQRDKEDKAEFNDHKKTMNNNNHSSHSKRTESPSVKNGAVIHCAPNHAPPPTTSCSSIPLNLVVHPGAEPHKKESELWVPWQQPLNHYSKDNQETGAHKMPAYRQHDNQRHYPVKEPHPNEKTNLQFSPTMLNEKKHHSTPNHIANNEIDAKKHTPDKKFDSLHHHIAELSSKEHGGAHEWRHEKLQKACTNNHRKSHESKKAKEDRNHLYQNHQRKPVNGVVIKAGQFQNEGMHARLLETEKSRIELNGHVMQKPSIQGHVNERLIVPTFKSSFHQGSEKELCPQKKYLDGYNLPVPKVTVDLTPVVSKLDKEAKDMQKNGFNFFEGGKEKDDLYLKNFLVVTKGPPLQLDVNPQKMKFLKLFGLTSRFKRKKIELDMYLKRRKILCDDSSLHNVNVEENEKEDSSLLNESSPHSEILAEKLRSETSPEKLEFYLKIGLSPITLVKKEERERIRKIVEDDKSRRHYRLLAKLNKKASPRRLFVPKSESAQKYSHNIKIKEEKVSSNGFFSRKLFNGEDKKLSASSASQIFASKNEQVPYLVSSETKDPLFSHKNAASKATSDRSSHNKSYNKYSFKRGHSLKHEWRYSSELTLTNNCFSAINGHDTCDATKRFKQISTGTQVETDLLSKDSENKDLTNLKSSFNWPGLEAVMEAFYRHQTDQSCERTVLSERCRQLRQSQEDLKKEADSVNKHMAELLKCKRDLDDETQKHQKALDRLKQCLQYRR